MYIKTTAYVLKHNNMCYVNVLSGSFIPYVRSSQEQRVGMFQCAYVRLTGSGAAGVRGEWLDLHQAVDWY